MNSKIWILSTALIFAVASASVGRAGLNEIIVNVDLTDAGRNVPPPTKEHPAHYLMMLGGFKEEGERVAGERIPPVNDVRTALIEALAGQGYLSVTKKTVQPPELLLVANWGVANPDEVESDTISNLGRMRELVGGKVFANMALEEAGRGRIADAAYDNRYFVNVAAFDFKAANASPSKKILLWTAHMSVPSNGVFLPDVMPALVKTGAPQFGKQTTFPRFVNVDIATLKEHVEVGPATVDKSDPAISEKAK